MSGADEAEGLLWRQCVALAGALAEAGTKRVEITSRDGSTRSLRSRESDLPGLLIAAPVGARVGVPECGLCLERTGNAWRVVTATSDAARRIASALGGAAKG